MDPSEPDKPTLPETPPESEATPEAAPVQSTPHEVVTSDSAQGRGHRSWAKSLGLLVVALVVIAGVAYAIYVTGKPAKPAQAVAVKKDIPQLTVGVINGAILPTYPAKNTDSYSSAVFSQIYEALVAYQDNTKIVPLLATGWSNPDSSTWDFDLRHNVTFHNGHTMKAADVVYSLKLAQQNESLAGIYANTIKDVKALNDYKVEVTTTKPDPFFLNKLTFLMILDASKPGATDSMNATGPYVLKPGTKSSATEIQLVAYDKYHGGHVYTRALNFINEPTEDSASVDFKAGKVNIAGEYNAKDPAQLKGTKYHQVLVDNTAVTFVTINSVSPGPLQKEPVREALRDSINIPQLIKATNLVAEPASQLITQVIPGFNPALSVPKSDIAKAKSLLTAAGYANGVSLTLQVSPINMSAAQEVARQAKEAGFNITVREEADFDKLITAVVGGKTELAMMSYSSDVFDSSDVFSQVIQQTSNYKSAALDSYLDQAAATVDQAQHLQILQKTSKYLYDDVAAIPLFSRQRVWELDKPYGMQFENITATPGVYFWKAYLTR